MAIGVDQNGDNELWWVSVLAKVVVFFFDFRCIDALKDNFVYKAVMTFGKQIENNGWKQQMLIKLNRTILELWWW